MATSESVLTQQLSVKRSRRLDLCLVAGVVIAVGAIITGLCCTGVGLNYFFQPTGVAIVLGGTLGVVLVSTPGHSIRYSLRRTVELVAAPQANREALIEDIVYYARAARRGGMLSVEPLIKNATNAFLGQALQLALDVPQRAEFEAVLDTEIRMAERHGEADAKTLEVAGGFAPTIGIMGTVVGLIEVLRQFSNLQSIGYGIGTAFVSTIYGLALANLLLLPAANRIRARVAENFETHELIREGVIAIVDTVHPSLIRMRLNSFLRGPRAR